MKRTVMVVDDSSSMRTLMRMALERSGYDVLETADGADAIDCLDGRDLHLVVCDMTMPRVNGLDFLRYLRVHPRYRRTPLVMLTTENRAEIKQLGRNSGAQAWITKPCPPHLLVETVDRLCPQ